MATEDIDHREKLTVDILLNVHTVKLSLNIYIYTLQSVILLILVRETFFILKNRPSSNLQATVGFRSIWTVQSSHLSHTEHLVKTPSHYY